MYQIDNEKFGELISEARREKGMTQKELGQRLFVSDKTVSKWERGASIPNVALLLPIAETLDLTVTELLKGERIQAEQPIGQAEVEGLVNQSLELVVKEAVKQNRRKWGAAFMASAALAIGGNILAAVSGAGALTVENIRLVSFLMLLFGGIFCFFIREILPGYYDENKIHYVVQGPFRMNMPGLSFNNGNWPHVCRAIKIWALSLGALFPWFSLAALHIAGQELWERLLRPVTLAAVFSLFIPIYIVGKKYE